MPYWNNARELDRHQVNPGEMMLYSRDVGHGPLEVVEDMASRCLRFGNQVNQSAMLLGDPVELLLPYTRAMMAVEMFLEEEPVNALVLGMGGGSMVKFLHFHHPDCLIDVVEIRDDVVEAAFQFFMLPVDERIKVIHGDGVDFVAGCRKKYDLLLIDLFDDRGMVESSSNPAFFAGCRELLTPPGIAAANLWNVERAHYEHMERLFAGVFAPDMLMLPLGRQANVILLGFPEPRPPHYLRRAGSRVTALETSLGLEFSRYLNLLKRHNPAQAGLAQGLA